MKDRISKLFCSLAESTGSALPLKLADFSGSNKLAAQSKVFIAGISILDRSSRAREIAMSIATSMRMPASDVVRAVMHIRKHKLVKSQNREDQTVYCASVVSDLCKHFIEEESDPSFADTFTYVDQMLSCAFSEAYDLWSKLPEQDSASYIDVLQPNQKMKSLAVVLPAPSTGQPGELIEQHEFVARTTTIKPQPEEFAAIGRRTDVLFVNRKWYGSLSRISDSSMVPPMIVTNNNDSFRHVRFRSAAIKERVQYTMRSPKSVTTRRTYIILRIVRWALLNGYKPTLYNADFYLGDSVYQNVELATKDKLAMPQGVVWSYLTHDVFYVHKFLKVHYEAGLIGAQGRLEHLLKMTGREFSALLESRWRSTDS